MLHVKPSLVPETVRLNYGLWLLLAALDCKQSSRATKSVPCWRTFCRYDSIQAARTQPKQQEKIERRSRYIAQLKEQADQRKREEVGDEEMEGGCSLLP